MKKLNNYFPIDVLDFDVRQGAGQAMYLAPGQWNYHEVIPYNFFDKENPYRKWLDKAEKDGFDPDTLVAKENIDRRKALRHITCLYNSYRSFFNDSKEGILAFLIYLWFEPEPLGITEEQINYIFFQDYIMG